MKTRYASWRDDWPHYGPGYRVRNRGGKSWMSQDGKVWTDIKKEPVDVSDVIICDSKTGERLNGRPREVSESRIENSKQHI